MSHKTKNILIVGLLTVFALQLWQAVKYEDKLMFLETEIIHAEGQGAVCRIIYAEPR